MTASEAATAELTKPRALPLVKNGVRLGLFLPNVRNAFFITSAEGGTDATYDAVRRVTKLGDDIGLSFALPAARWKSLSGENADFCPYGFDTITLTAGLLECTEKITVFSTLHTELFNPVIAAKLGADMDHIGNGRWGLNIVAGWSFADFNSMGLALREHEDRYAHAQSWLDAVRELWLTGHSSHKSVYFELNDAECRPQPLQEGGPVVVNAGRSATGMRFAIRNGAYLFSASPTAEEFKIVSEEVGTSDVGYIGRKFVLLGRTRAEAEQLANDIVAGNDLKAQAKLLAHGARSAEEAEAELQDEGFRRRVILEGAVIGGPEEVAVELATWCAETSVDGICLTMWNYEQELELMAESVFERLGNELATNGKTLVLT